MILYHSSFIPICIIFIKRVHFSKYNAIRNDALITSSPDSDVDILQSETTSVNKKNGIAHSLDLSTDTETEDRGWDLPEALEEQLIAELESSYAEDEEVPEDVYIDGEAKDYVEIFGENDKSF